MNSEQQPTIQENFRQYAKYNNEITLLKGKLHTLHNGRQQHGSYLFEQHRANKIPFSGIIKIDDDYYYYSINPKYTSGSLTNDQFNTFHRVNFLYDISSESNDVGISNVSSWLTERNSIKTDIFNSSDGYTIKVTYQVNDAIPRETVKTYNLIEFNELIRTFDQKLSNMGLMRHLEKAEV